MKQLWLIPIAFVVLAIPVAVLAGSGEGNFDGVVHSIENRYHVRATHIPFLGLAISLVSNKASHGAVVGLHVAEIEQFTEPVDGDELNRMVEEKLGSGWERMLRETNRSGHNQTLIFTHPEGDRMAMFVVDLSGNEMDVVQMSVDPQHLDDDISQYRHHHRDSERDNEKSDGASD